MKYFTMKLLLIAGVFVVSTAYGQRSDSYRSTSPNSEITEQEPDRSKPEIGQEFIDLQYGRIEQSLTGVLTGDDAIKTFSQDDVDAYLESFSKVSGEGYRLDDETARNRIEGIADDAARIMGELKNSTQVTLVDQQVMFSDSRKIHEMISYTVEVFDKNEDVRLVDMIVMYINGEYKIMHCRDRY